MKLMILFVLMFVSQVWAGSVRLSNNTAYKLRAMIRAADGTYLGEVVVMPQQNMQWNDYWGGIGYYNQSQTPYTVIWFCVEGGDFSVCDNVSSGSTITAYGCPGTRSCPPKKNQEHPPQYGAPTEENMPQQLQQEEIEKESGPPQGMLQ